MKNSIGILHHPLLALTTMYIAGFGMIMGSTLPVSLWAQDGSVQVNEIWEETPYLWAGKILEELKPSIAENVVPKYGALRFLYPSADACLEPLDGGGTEIQGRDLIWYELETKEAVSMCLFRVFTALGELAKIEVWLESQGFGSRLESDHTKLGLYYGMEGERIANLSMVWRTSVQGALYGITEKQRREQGRDLLHQTANFTITEKGLVLGARLSEQSTRLK